jgi:hypothetical protein
MRALRWSLLSTIAWSRLIPCSPRSAHCRCRGSVSTSRSTIRWCITSRCATPGWACAIPTADRFAFSRTPGRDRFLFQTPQGLAIAPGLFIFIGEYFMTTTRECAHCGERFSLVQRSGRDSYRARANRERSYHQEQRYCSATCRKLASKARRARSGTPVKGAAFEKLAALVRTIFV